MGPAVPVKYPDLPQKTRKIPDLPSIAEYYLEHILSPASMASAATACCRWGGDGGSALIAGERGERKVKILKGGLNGLVALRAGPFKSRQPTRQTWYLRATEHLAL